MEGMTHVFFADGSHAGHWQFKHRTSRNYLLLADTTGNLTVPTGSAFCRGTFDVE